MFQGCFNGVLSNFQGRCCFMNVWRVLQGILKGVSREFDRSLKGISRKFQRRLRQVLWVLRECFKELQRKFKSVLSASMKFHDCFKVSSSMFCLFFKVV